MAAPDKRPKALRRLLLLAALMGLGVPVYPHASLYERFSQYCFRLFVLPNFISSCSGSAAARRLAQSCNNDHSCPVTGALNGVSPPHCQLRSSSRRRAPGDEPPVSLPSSWELFSSSPLERNRGRSAWAARCSFGTTHARCAGSLCGEAPGLFRRCKSWEPLSRRTRQRATAHPEK